MASGNTAELPVQFKAALRRFPSGVTVVTAAPAGTVPQAITVSAFSSVSLDPPLILVCLNSHGRAAEIIAAEPRFCVNVLSVGQADDSRACTAPADDRLACVEWHPGANGCPVLARAAASLECDHYALHPAGDHVILVGRVTAIHLGDGTEPLVYHDGDYAGVTKLGSDAVGVGSPT